MRAFWLVPSWSGYEVKLAVVVGRCVCVWGGQTKGAVRLFSKTWFYAVMYRANTDIPSIPGVACPCIMCWGSSLFPGSPLHPTNNSMGMLYTLGTANDIRGFTMLPNPEFYRKQRKFKTITNWNCTGRMKIMLLTVAHYISQPWEAFMHMQWF